MHSVTLRMRHKGRRLTLLMAMPMKSGLLGSYFIIYCFIFIRAAQCHRRSLYFCGDIPVCFLKNVPKLDGLGNRNLSAISATVMFVLSSRDIALRVIALNTSCWTVYPHIDLDSSERYLAKETADRHKMPLRVQSCNDVR